MSEKTYRVIWSTPQASGKLASQIKHVINVAMIEEAADIKISVETPDETALRKRLVEAEAAHKRLNEAVKYALSENNQRFEHRAYIAPNDTVSYMLIKRFSESNAYFKTHKPLEGE